MRGLGFTLLKSYLDGFPWECFSTIKTSVCPPPLSASPPLSPCLSSFSLFLLKWILIYCNPPEYQARCKVLGIQPRSSSGSWASMFSTELSFTNTMKVQSQASLLLYVNLFIRLLLSIAPVAVSGQMSGWNRAWVHVCPQMCVCEGLWRVQTTAGLEDFHPCPLGTLFLIHACLKTVSGTANK